MRKATTFARLFREQGSRKAVKLMSKRQWKYPAALEHQYARSIKFYLDKTWKGYADTLIDSYIPAHTDALEDIWPEDPTRGPVLGALVTIAENMEKFNRQEWDAFKKIAVGAAFSEDDAWTQSVIDNWARTQVTLITKASNDMRDAVARRVRKGVAEGQNNDEVKALIMRDLPGISTRRAAIIARDQTAKLNGDLAQGRMEQAGIETYIWSTSMDERVRGLPGGKYSNAVPSHYLMEGLVCRWDDPTKYRNASGEWVSRPAGAPLLHPGQDILCRCVALPNWDELDELTDATPEERAQTELEAAQDALARATTAASYIDPSNPARDTFIKEQERAQAIIDKLLVKTPTQAAAAAAKVVTDVAAVKKIIGETSMAVTAGTTSDETLAAFGQLLDAMDPDQRAAYEWVFPNWVTAIGKAPRDKGACYYDYRKIHVWDRANTAHKINASVIVHEAGHAIDDALGWMAKSRAYAGTYSLAWEKGFYKTLEPAVSGLMDNLSNAFSGAVKDALVEFDPAAIRAAASLSKTTMDPFSNPFYLAWRDKTTAEFTAIKYAARYSLNSRDWDAIIKAPDDKIKDVFAATIERVTRSDVVARRHWTDVLMTSEKSPLCKFSTMKDPVLRQRSLAVISDMLDGATRGKLNFGFSHGPTYWRNFERAGAPRGFAATLEGWAETNELMALGPDCKWVLDELLPGVETKAREIYADAIKQFGGTP